MEPTSVIRRRRVPRREFKGRLGLLIRGSYHMSRALQIGEGGMRLRSPVALRVGQNILINYKLPTEAPDVVRAVVRYKHQGPNTQGLEYGVEFVTLSFRGKREVRNYVATKSYAEARNLVF